MKCPNPECKNAVIQKSGAALKLRLKGPVMVEESGLVRGKCFWCGTEVELPLELKKSHVAERYIVSRQGS